MFTRLEAALVDQLEQRVKLGVGVAGVVNMSWGLTVKLVKVLW